MLLQMKQLIIISMAMSRLFSNRTTSKENEKIEEEAEENTFSLYIIFFFSLDRILNCF